MNVYDCAHQLAKFLKTSDEYLNFTKCREEIIKEPKLKKILKDFQQKQLELQTLQITGKEIDDGKINQVQKLYEILMKDPKTKEYLEAEIRFSQLMNDINNIIAKAIDIESIFED